MRTNKLILLAAAGTMVSCAALMRLVADPDRLAPTGMTINPKVGQEGEAPFVCRDDFEPNDPGNWIAGCAPLAVPLPSPQPSASSSPIPDPEAPTPTPPASPTPTALPVPTASPGPTPAPSPEPCEDKAHWTVDGHTTDGTTPKRFPNVRAACTAMIERDDPTHCQKFQHRGELWCLDPDRGSVRAKTCDLYDQAGGKITHFVADGYMGVHQRGEPCPDPTPTPPRPGGCLTQPDGTPWPVIAQSCSPVNGQGGFWARQGLAQRLNRVGENRYRSDTTTRYCRNNGCNRGPAGNDDCSAASDRTAPNYVSHTGGRQCDPDDRGPRRLRLECSGTNGVTCEQGGDNENPNAYFVYWRVPRHIDQWEGKVCLARGNTSKVTGETLTVSSTRCSRRVYKRSEAR